MASRSEYCETCKADREVRRSVLDPSDKDRQLITLVCGHSFGKLVKVADLDTVGISDNFYWLILKDPVAEIKKAVKDNDYFKTVAYACSVFEFCGKQILVWHSRKSGKALSGNVAEWRLKKVINVLYDRKIIEDRSVKKKMHEIRDLRNKFIHKESSLKLTPEIVNKVNSSTQDIISCVG